VRVDDRSLADVYRAWIEAGKQLGRHVQERARVEASLGAGGTSTPRTSVRKVRAAWIRAVHLLLDVQDFLGLSAEAREMMLAPLQDGIDDALARRRARTPGGDDMPADAIGASGGIADIDGIDDIDDSGSAIDRAVRLGFPTHHDAEFDGPTLELDDDMSAGVLACDDVAP
jgi:hypothetical protein